MEVTQGTKVGGSAANATTRELHVANPCAEETACDPRDRAAILAMAGAFSVEFNFRETVAIQQQVALREPYHEVAPVELALVLCDEPNRIVLQHLLVFGPKVVKHWRQDWLYENQDLYEYEPPLAWRHRRLSASDVVGTWTQRVFQIDDSPRYQCFGRWTHDLGLSSWESNWTPRPKPRRELKRDDYELLVTRNRHSLTSFGWVHEQDSYKRRAQDDQTDILVRESGLSRYTRIDVARAVAAERYWSRYAERWAVVTAFWAGRLVPGGVLAMDKACEETFPESLLAFVESADGPLSTADLHAFAAPQLSP